MSSERRVAPRIGCRIPVLLRGEWTSVQADVADLSRAGARLQVAVSELGLPRGANLSEVARQLRHLLTMDVHAQFYPERLGSLIQRRIHPVRITRMEAESPLADVGCFFNEPLSPVEAAALGLVLPMEGETLEEAQAYQKAVAPQTREPQHAADGTVEVFDFGDLERPPRIPLRAYVIPTARPSQEPLVGYVDETSAGTVEITLPDRKVLGLPLGCRDVSRIQAAFHETCGPDVVLGIADGPERLWSGRAQLDTIGVSPHATDALRLRFVLHRPMRPSEAALLA